MTAPRTHLTSHRLMVALVVASQLLTLSPAGSQGLHLAAFSDGRTEAIARFGEKGGNATPARLGLPASAYILNASLSLEGLPAVITGGRMDTTDEDFGAMDGQRNISISEGSVTLARASGQWAQSSDDDFRKGKLENAEVSGGVRLAKGALFTEAFADRAVSPSPHSQGGPAAAVNSLGNLFLVWEDLRNGEDLDLYGRVLDSKGDPLTAEFPVCTEPRHQYNPAVAQDASGNFILLWQDGRSGDFDIRGRRYDQLGAPLGAEFSACNANGDQSRPAVAVAPDGKFLAVWDDYRDGLNYHVRSILLGYDGSPHGMEVALTSFPVDQMAPSACALASGFAVVWQNSTNSSGADLEGAVLDASGQPGGPAFAVASAPFNQSGPVMAPGPSGRFAVVWEDRRGGGDFDLRGKWFDPSGKPVGSEAALEVAPGDQRHPSLSSRPSGDLLVAWEDGRGKDADAYFKRFDSNWNAVGTGTLACGERRDQAAPAAAFDASGAFFIAWSDWRDGLPALRLKKWGAPVDGYSSGELLSPRIPSPASTFGSLGICITLPRVAKSPQETTGFRVDVLDGREDYILQSDVRPGARLAASTRHHDSIRLRLHMWTRDHNITPVLEEWWVGTGLEEELSIPAGTFAGTRNVGGDAVLASDGTLTTVTGDVPVKATTANDYQVSVAKFPLGRGEYVAAWQELAGTGDYNILARVFSAAGQPLSQELAVCNAPGLQERPSVAVDLNGQFIVVWSDNRTGTDADIFGRRFAPSGDPLGPEFAVHANESDQKTPRVATDLANNFVVVWVDWSKIYSLTFVRKFRPDGTPLTPPVQVSWTQFNLLQPAVAVDGHDRIIVAWADYRSGSNSDIYAASFNPDLTRLHPGQDIAVSSRAGNQLYPSLATDTSDDFLVAWEDWYLGAHSDIHCQKFDFNGTPLTGEVALSTGPAIQGEPSVAFDSQGNFFAAWHQMGDGFDLVGRHFGPSGEPLAPELTICAVKNVEGEPADQMHASVSCGPGDDLVVAWVDNRPKYEMDAWAKLYGFPRHLSAGTFLGPSIDLGCQPLTFDEAGWTGSVPPGTAITASLRSSANGLSWSAWEDLPELKYIFSTPPARHVQFQFSLRTDEALSTPVLEGYRLRYTTHATNGTFTSPPVEASAPISGLSVGWNATLDLQALVVEATQDGGASWRDCGSGGEVETDRDLKGSRLSYRVFLYSDGFGSPVLEDISLVYTATSWPSDVWLDLGSDGSPEWSRAGELNETLSIGGLEDPLNRFLAGQSGGPEDVPVPLMIHSSSAGLIRVSNVSVLYNVPPVIHGSGPEGPEAFVLESERLRFWVDATDGDGDRLSYTWKVNGRVVGAREEYELATDHGSAGTYDVSVSISDTFFTVNRSWALTVVNNNRLPVVEWSPRSDVMMNETEKASFWAAASDPDGEEVTVRWSLDGQVVATGMAFDYITDHRSEGTHRVTGEASDGQGRVFRNWTVEVANRNRAPMISRAIPDPNETLKLSEGRSQLFGIEASDPDGDPLSYAWSINGNPVAGETGASFECRKGLRVGGNVVRAEVSDGDATVIREWTVRVVGSPSGTTSGTPSGLAALSGLAVALVLVAAAVLLLRRRQGQM